MNDDIINLQIKIAHLEHTLEALDRVIAHQDQIIKDLQDQLKLIYRQLQNKDDDIMPFDLLADRPPHY